MDAAPGLRQALQRHGFVVVPSWLTPVERAHLHNYINAAIARVIPLVAEVCDHTLRPSQQLLAELAVQEGLELASYVRRAVIRGAGNGIPDFLNNSPHQLPLLARVLGCAQAEYSLSQVSVNVPGGADEPSGVTGWHQDFEDAGVLGVWMPLQDSVLQNGCLRFMPHIRDPRPHTLMPRDPRDLALIDEADLVDTPVDAACPAGGAVLFSTMAPHATRPNLTRQSRWALVCWVRPRPVCA